MFRKLAGVAVLSLLMCATMVWAAEVKGKATKVDEPNHKITITVDGKDTEYTVSKDCKFVPAKSKGKDGTERDNDLKSLARIVDRMKDKGGVGVTVTTTKKDGKEVVTEIKTEARGKKKSDKSE